MPAALWPAPRTVTGIPVFRASFTEAATSAVPVQHTIIAGRLSIIALCILRSASYFGWVGNNTSPRIEAFRALMASSETMVPPGPLVELPYMLLSFALAVNARGLVSLGFGASTPARLGYSRMTENATLGRTDRAKLPDNNT